MKILTFAITLLLTAHPIQNLNLLRRISPCLSSILNSGRCVRRNRISQRNYERTTERQRRRQNDQNGRLSSPPRLSTNSKKDKDITIRRKKDYRVSGNLSVESQDRKRISSENGLFRSSNGSNSGRRGRYVFIEDEGQGSLRGGGSSGGSFEDSFVEKIVDRVRDDLKRNDDSNGDRNDDRNGDSNGDSNDNDRNGDDSNDNDRNVDDSNDNDRNGDDSNDNDRNGDDRNDNDRNGDDRNGDDRNGSLAGFRDRNGEREDRGDRIFRLFRSVRRRGSLLDRLKKYKGLGKIMIGNSLS